MPRLTSAIVVAILSLALLPSSSTAQATPRSWFVAPAAAGSASGESPTDAAGIQRLNDVVQRAEAGDHIVLLADRGEYHLSRPLNLNAGGDPGAPITIRGGTADGSPARAVIRGNRARPWTPGGSTGRDTFRLNRGSDHLRITDLTFEDVGSAVRVTGDLTGLRIDHVDAVNVRRFFDTLATRGQPTASLSQAALTDITVRGFSKHAVRLQYDSRDILVQDVLGDSERQDGDNFAMGVHLTGTVHDVTFRRVGMHNSHDTQNSYWNGDGFAAERGTYRLRFEDTSANGSTDAGYDLKSTDTVLIGARAADNKRNIRIWGSATILGCVSERPHHRGGTGRAADIFLAEGASAAIHGCQFINDGAGPTIHGQETAAAFSITDTLTAEQQQLLDDVLGVPPAPPVTHQETSHDVPAGYLLAAVTEGEANGENLRVDGGGAGDPVGQALETSWALFDDGGADRVVIATADRFPDALAGGAIAGDRGPLLLVGPGDTLDPRIDAEIRRVTGGQGTVLTLGGTAVVSEVVAAQARAAAGDVACAYPLPTSCRFAGTGREHTAALIADAVFAEHPQSTRALLARSDDYADAITGAAYAAAAGVPILLTTGDVLSDPTAAWFAGHPAIDTAIILGGEAAVSAEAAGALPVAVERVSGPDRISTSVEIANRLWGPEQPSDAVLLVNVRHDQGWQTAVAAAPASAVLNAPQLALGAADTPPAGALLDTVAGLSGPAIAFGDDSLVGELPITEVRAAQAR